MVKRYRHKPTEVQVLLFTGDNLKEAKKFLGRYFSHVEDESIVFEGGYDDVSDCCPEGWYLVKHGSDTVNYFTCMTKSELEKFRERYLEEVGVGED